MKTIFNEMNYKERQREEREKDTFYCVDTSKTKFSQ